MKPDRVTVSSTAGSPGRVEVAFDVNNFIDQRQRNPKAGTYQEAIDKTANEGDRLRNAATRAASDFLRALTSPLMRLLQGGNK